VSTKRLVLVSLLAAAIGGSIAAGRGRGRPAPTPEPTPESAALAGDQPGERDEAGDRSRGPAGLRAAPVAGAAGEPAIQSSDGFETLELTPQQKQVLHELEALGPTRLARAVAQIILGGYHHEALVAKNGLSMDEFAARRMAILKADPQRTLALLDGALHLPSLAQPDVAYARGTLLGIAAQLPQQGQRTSELALRELTERPLPPIPAPSPAQLRAASPEERAALTPPRPEYNVEAYAHAVYVETSPDPRAALGGTVKAIVAQQDPSLRTRLVGQLLQKHPQLASDLTAALASAGVFLPSAPAEATPSSEAL
jgi:hypothetical protein